LCFPRRVTGFENVSPKTPVGKKETCKLCNGRLCLDTERAAIISKQEVLMRTLFENTCCTCLLYVTRYANSHTDRHTLTEMPLYAPPSRYVRWCWDSLDL